MAAAPVSFPKKETARKAPSPHTAKTFTESWASTKPISSKSASRFCVRSEKHKTEQETSRPCQALSLTGAASDVSFSSCFSPALQNRPRSAARHSERFPCVFRCRCTRSSSQSCLRSIFLFFLCPVSSGRVGSSGCAMVTLPYGQNFESKNVTVPPWREAVTFSAWSADINRW